ncbi:aspartyl protease [Scopulibacillus darangshiensis]|uniref:Aspartyl protease n=1 Tax=Scopulibacillus darangshiensis TaxID=442528 RepID=A0A4R2ND33_9BACL|nr:retropepsin-like aspartic protease [Scopulibacillus darangshiensis]TCP19141.1 aspartyl protease [Scopulibacillus darangshiensis]
MKKLVIDNGLLLTDMKLVFNRRMLGLQRVLVDTGSGSTIVSIDLAEEIGVIAEENNMIYRISGVGGSEFVYSKTVDSVRIGDMQTKDFAIEIGAMNYGFDLEGKIGLDLLQRLKVVINVNKLTIESDW